MARNFIELPEGIYDPKWEEKGECRQFDPDEAFPESLKDERRFINIVCKGGDCAVRHSCLVDALENNEKFGVWGGLTHVERRKINKELFLENARIDREAYVSEVIDRNNNPEVTIGNMLPATDLTSSLGSRAVGFLGTIAEAS